MKHLANSFSAQFGLLKFFIRDNYDNKLLREYAYWRLYRAEKMVYRLIQKEEHRLK